MYISSYPFSLNLYTLLMIQKFEVLPNEFSKEKPYIATNIEYTLKGYGLQNVNIKDFPADESLSLKEIKKE